MRTLFLMMILWLLAIENVIAETNICIDRPKDQRQVVSDFSQAFLSGSAEPSTPPATPPNRVRQENSMEDIDFTADMTEAPIQSGAYTPTSRSQSTVPSNQSSGSSRSTRSWGESGSNEESGVSSHSAGAVANSSEGHPAGSEFQKSLEGQTKAESFLEENKLEEAKEGLNQEKSSFRNLVKLDDPTYKDNFFQSVDRSNKNRGAAEAIVNPGEDDLDAVSLSEMVQKGYYLSGHSQWFSAARIRESNTRDPNAKNMFAREIFWRQDPRSGENNVRIVENINRSGKVVSVKAMRKKSGSKKWEAQYFVRNLDTGEFSVSKIFQGDRVPYACAKCHANEMKSAEVFPSVKMKNYLPAKGWRVKEKMSP